MKETPKFRSRYVPTSISKSRIPFHISSNKTFKLKLEGQSLICLAPDKESVCECGKSCWSDELEECDNIKIFTKTDNYSAKSK